MENSMINRKKLALITAATIFFLWIVESVTQKNQVII